ncbi:MFS transporter [Rhodococcoides yunnanense]|uniref:MFS transporter n=1 Tax=Rhodococcoides yunnanense TaxID=278209 RepID=UPI00093229A8|nr:MFS transporter [Rhodococcus yunnanensis]
MQNKSQASLPLLLTVLAGAPFLASLDLFVVNVAFDDIGMAFPGHTLGELSWILNVYAIVFAALLIPLGRWSDRVGRKRGFVLGLALFTAASVLAAAAPTLEILIGGRVLQAAGAALLTPTSLGLLIDAVPAEKRAGAVRVWAALGALAAAFGPVVGGLLVELSWRWVFVINIPIGVVLVVLALRFVPDSAAGDPADTLDLAGALALTVGIGTLALGLVQGPDWGWSSAGIVTSFVVAALAVGAFWRNNRKHPSPLVDPALVRVRTFAWANLAGLLFSAAFAAGLLANIFWLQQVWGYSALAAGLAIAPGPAVVPLFSYLGQRLARRVGPGVTASIGCVLLAAGSVLILLSVDTTPGYVTAFLPGWLVAGAGVGLALPTILSSATADIPAAVGATGSAIVNMSRQIGTVAGISALVAILGSIDGQAGFTTAWWVISGIGVASALAALGMHPRAVHEPSNSAPSTRTPAA